MNGEYDVKGKRAVIYTRVSGLTQAREGGGLDDQYDECLRWAKYAQVQLIQDDPISDEGITGVAKGLEKRDGLDRVISLAENGDIDLMIVHNFERIGRETGVIVNTKDRLKAHGVDIFSCRDGVHTGTAMGKLMMTILSGFAEMDKDNVTEKMADGRKRKFLERDGDIGGHIVYGYQRVNKETVVEETHAETVRMIFAWHDSGLSLNKIAMMLNSMNTPTPQPKGQYWYASTVKVILSHRKKYEGGARGEGGFTWPVILEVA